MYNLKNSELCQQFSGLFKLTNLKSEFKHGEFKQTIQAYRIQGQDSKDNPTESSILSTTKNTVVNTGMSPDLPPGIQTPTIVKAGLNSLTPSSLQSLNGNN